MKITKAEIYVLNIPFKDSFGHFLKIRHHSDSIIVKLITNEGIVGYGEGIARPYVTGETVTNSVDCIEKVLLPEIINKNIQDIKATGNPLIDLSYINKCFSYPHGSNDVFSWHASKTSVELAIIDILLQIQQKSLNWILPERSETVTYSGVFSSGNLAKTIKLAKLAKDFGFKYIKIKVGGKDDIKRISAVRDILGGNISIRLDANGAFNIKEAMQFIKSVEKFDIDCIEQPIARGSVSGLEIIKSNTSIPIMVDESIVTYNDAQELIANNACDYFNLRISKCGGIYNTLAIADLAKRENIKIQLGCHVGETAILSSVGRHIAAYLDSIDFVEGSFGTMLLKEDIAEESINFGQKGVASVLNGVGFGIKICDQYLEKYAVKKIKSDEHKK